MTVMVTVTDSTDGMDQKNERRQGAMAAMNRMIVAGFAASLLVLAALPLSSARAADQRECRDDGRGGIACERAQKRREIRHEERLSPEERRQLRRDIKDAGREIYPRQR